VWISILRMGGGDRKPDSINSFLQKIIPSKKFAPVRDHRSSHTVSTRNASEQKNLKRNNIQIKKIKQFLKIIRIKEKRNEA
jgi:hypothetical protein